MDGAWMISFAISISIGIVMQSHNIRVISILREPHTQKWKELGSLSFCNSTILNNYAFLKFLFTKQYVDLEGPDFHRLCRRTKFFICSFFVSFMVSIVFFEF